ncbi:hypothetical protein NHX12_034505 [Muraenolepis orangiensis]|uniref:Uncharacterized protein n=1 Tax=Muraenolepis orangiensis TaxID=630683 RepID=A0A9Q0I2N1_9TELE|nr:hypothetical protein NHX12_034505 [Muraenolepis orangiensis]
MPGRRQPHSGLCSHGALHRSGASFAPSSLLLPRNFAAAGKQGSFSALRFFQCRSIWRPLMGDPLGPGEEEEEKSPRGNYGLYGGDLDYSPPRLSFLISHEPLRMES